MDMKDIMNGFRHSGYLPQSLQFGIQLVEIFDRGTGTEPFK